MPRLRDLNVPLNAPGRLVHHARKLVLKIGLAAARIHQRLAARPLLANA
jgi:hypothetical protein